MPCLLCCSLVSERGTEKSDSTGLVALDAAPAVNQLLLLQQRDPTCFSLWAETKANSSVHSEAAATASSSSAAAAALY